MAWSENFRVASFQSLLAVPRLRIYGRSGSVTEPVRSQSRALLLDSMLWLEFGVRIGYWGDRTAGLALRELTPAFDGIYTWLRAIPSGSLADGPVDDVLRIKGEGLSESYRPIHLSVEARDAAGQHFQNAITFLGRNTCRRQGAFSSLAAAIMFASEHEWLAVMKNMFFFNNSSAVDDAAGVLRYMEGALAIANAAASDSRFHLVESQTMSNEIVSRMTWALNLGSRTARQRFDEFFGTAVAAISEDDELARVGPRLREEVSNLAQSWEVASRAAERSVSVTR